MQRYGTSDYPVRDGTAWKAGPHVFLCGDVLMLAASGMLDRHIPQVASVYTDPPWNTGNAKMFFGFAGREVPRTFDAFLDGLVALLKHKCPTGAIGIEMGLKSMGRLRALLDLHDASTWGKGVTTYGSPARPLEVWFGTFGTQRRVVEVPPGLHGKDALKFGVATVAGESFLDPCCGDLTFSMAAINHGVPAVYGTELIPAKLASGLQKLSRSYPVQQIE